MKLVARLHVFHMIKQILTILWQFYFQFSFMTILISFFFQFQEKRKLNFINFFFVFFLFLFHSIPCIPTPIHCIPTLIPRIPTLIPRILNLIPSIPTLILRVPIITLIPFPDSPFRLLQIVNNNLRSSSWHVWLSYGLCLLLVSKEKKRLIS